ncbi:MAG: hypothetical protein KAU31_15745, partial [Spirochaetaceae bacterium]|nr:hypothetical protein [Spirochaetaceae bacterium]
MPRAVLAEGVMDMARLAYANPELAKSAILTLVRDTPDDNVPCVFASGEYNMVAEDGSTCGTSPAWCIPFFYLYGLHLRTLDSSWIEQLYPHLVRYVDFWLANRTDAEGWLTYKCTWEAGEDNNPRIDPLQTGDNVISGFVRPVELQASLAHAGYVLSRFASIVGNTEDEQRFEKIRNEYTNRTQELWDPDTSRFRDWDCTAGSFVQVSGDESYWGADFTRQSPMSLTALLFDTATEDEKQSMRSEVRSFFRPPFTVWASWASVAIEAAAALQMPDLCGSFAYETARRVYAITDRRDTMEFAGPSPGSAAEYWPHALATFTGNDAYAWGAQTASFIIRHILGIRSSEGSGLGLTLTPSLSPECRKSGCSFGIDNVAHRELRLSVEYRSDGDGTWH